MNRRPTLTAGTGPPVSVAGTTGGHESLTDVNRGDGPSVRGGRDNQGHESLTDINCGEGASGGDGMDNRGHELLTNIDRRGVRGGRAHDAQLVVDAEQGSLFQRIDNRLATVVGAIAMFPHGVLLLQKPNPRPVGVHDGWGGRGETMRNFNEIPSKNPENLPEPSGKAWLRDQARR
jgi:hypothetical protein